MRFPNAQEGVRKVYHAAIVDLIASLFLSGAVAAGAASLAASKDIGTGLIASIGVSTVLIIIGSIIGLIALVLQMIGLNKAAQDEKNFQIAMYAAIASIVASIVSGFITQKPEVANLVESLCRVLDLFIVACVVKGIQNLALELNDQAMAQKGSRVLTLIIVMVVVSLAAAWIAAALQQPIVALVAGVALIVLTLVQYIAYLKYLSAATVMLEK